MKRIISLVLILVFVMSSLEFCNTCYSYVVSLPYDYCWQGQVCNPTQTFDYCGAGQSYVPPQPDFQPKPQSPPAYDPPKADPPQKPVSPPEIRVVNGISLLTALEIGVFFTVMLYLHIANGWNILNTFGYVFLAISWVTDVIGSAFFNIVNLWNCVMKWKQKIEGWKQTFDSWTTWSSWVSWFSGSKETSDDVNPEHGSR